MLELCASSSGCNEDRFQAVMLISALRIALLLRRCRT